MRTALTILLHHGRLGQEKGQSGGIARLQGVHEGCNQRIGQHRRGGRAVNGIHIAPGDARRAYEEQGLGIERSQQGAVLTVHAAVACTVASFAGHHVRLLTGLHEEGVHHGVALGTLLNGGTVVAGGLGGIAAVQVEVVEIGIGGKDLIQVLSRIGRRENESAVIALSGKRTQVAERSGHTAGYGRRDPLPMGVALAIGQARGDAVTVVRGTLQITHELVPVRIVAHGQTAYHELLVVVKDVQTLQLINHALAIGVGPEQVGINIVVSHLLDGMRHAGHGDDVVATQDEEIEGLPLGTPSCTCLHRIGQQVEVVAPR